MPPGPRVTRDRRPERRDPREQRRHDRAETPLEASWRADADELPHEEAEIETGRVDQQSLEDVRMPAKVQATHAAGFVEMREGPLQTFAALRDR